MITGGREWVLRAPRIRKKWGKMGRLEKICQHGREKLNAYTKPASRARHRYEEEDCRSNPRTPKAVSRIKAIGGVGWVGGGVLFTAALQKSNGGHTVSRMTDGRQESAFLNT